jgi:hypothetical protein
MTERARAITVIALCQVAVLALWFSATAVLPALQAQVGLDPAMASLFTSAVQLGFVAGTLLSAFLGLADRIDPRVFFMWSAGVAALANALLAVVLFTLFDAIGSFLVGQRGPAYAADEAGIFLTAVLALAIGAWLLLRASSGAEARSVSRS